jgi:ribose transport system substrate-binding protein
MGAKIACAGKVAITMSGPSDAESAVAAAFTKELQLKCPSLAVLTPQVETTDPNQAIAVAGSILQANKDLTGAFSTTGGGATAWAKATAEAGRKPGEITIIGMDFTVENLDKVKDGEVYALVAQPVYTEMYHTVVLLLETVMGEQVPYENTLPSPLIYKPDLAKYYAIDQKADQLKLP